MSQNIADISVFSRAHQVEPIPASRPQRIGALALSIAAFVGFYVLSAGPVSALHKAIKFKPLQNGLEAFYAPLVWIVEKRVEPLATPLQWYVRLFR